jgi:RNA polymerase sigma-70 factor (ECF subfamily)
MERAALADQMERLADGERDAFRPVFDAIWPRARALAIKLVGPSDADDAAQRALVKLFEQADRYRRGTDPIAWGLSITAWECRTIRRRRDRSRTGPLVRDHAGDELDPEDRTLMAELEEIAITAIGTLTSRDRDTLALALAADPTARPVAGATFRKRRQRATERLRAAIRRIYDGT